MAARTLRIGIESLNSYAIIQLMPNQVLFPAMELEKKSFQLVDESSKLYPPL
jgi:hypothetical protein